MARDNLDPSMQNILNNEYVSSSFFTQTADRPRSGLSERGFSARAQNDYQQNHEQPRSLMTDPPALDDFDRNLLGFDQGSRQQQAEQGRARLSIAPRGVNYDSSSYNSSNQAFGMQAIHSRPQRQPIVSSQRPLQLPNVEVGFPEPTAIFHGASRINQLQPTRQQATPPFSISAGFAYAPNHPQVAVNKSSSPIQPSSPSAHIMHRRISHQAPVDVHQSALVSHSGHEPADSNLIRAPVTPERQTSAPISRIPQALALGHAPPIVQGIQLVSPHELPDRFRQVFPYALFNAVQSKCFSAVYKTNENVVVSAPTGSGKTAILELAVCKLVESFDVGRVKIIYLAPTKSLCSERVRDWDKKFRHMGLKCALLTGDTSSSEMKTVGESVIIVTTPEKWDSITRKWKDHRKLLEMVKLVLVDEVHILKDTRGATLEAVVSRMKTIGASVRFIALSATVPNSQDIATWLGRDHTNGHIPAHRETFGEDFRPVKLQKHIHGFESNGNDYAFDSILDQKLPGLITKYTHKKPMMVFSFTRKFCEKTAHNLAEWWGKCRDNDRAWPAPTQRLVTTHKEINHLLSCGVAFHHAGLEAQDRSIIEKGFLEGQIHVICCTSTLAVGVNLPCHLVVIKNTVGFQDGGKLAEYSDLEVMQMLGRAGRPQFDDSAVAIIMTRNEKVDRYKKMISGQEILESTLHLNLIEHLNSEVGLGTISDVQSAKRWLSSTFLAVRMRQNPNHYKLDGVTNTRDIDQKLEQVCERDISLLQQTNLITDNGPLRSTEYGEAMSRYMVQFETMRLILKIPERARMSKILHTIAQAPDFHEQVRMKANERNGFRELNKSPLIKWPVKENITTTAHKVSIMIQAELSGVELPNDQNASLNRSQYLSEKRLIFEHIQRLLKCFIDCRAYDCDATSTGNALELARSIGAGYWENSPMQLRQINGLGPAAVRRFIGANINSIEKLRNTDPENIERILSKNPPFGRKLRNDLGDFPRLTLKAEFMRPGHSKAGDPITMTVKAHLGLASTKASHWNGKLVTVTFIAEVSDGTLINFWRGGLYTLLRSVDLKFDAVISSPEDTIICTLACDEVVGTTCEVELIPNLPLSAFPKPKPKAVQQKSASGQKNGARVSNIQDTKDDDDDEFAFDDMDTTDMIAAVKNVESSKLTVQVDNDDGYVDVDNYHSPKASTRIEKQPNKSEKMRNGKWKCNHECADGAPTKSGGHCKHQCCREGLDKPRKRPPPKKKDLTVEIKSEFKGEATHGKTATKSNRKKAPESKLRIASREDQEKQRKMTVDVIDLADPKEESNYASMAPRDYRKLHSLHEKVQGGSAVKLPKTTPSYSYKSGAKPNPFSLSESSIEEEYGSEIDYDYELPDLQHERLEVVSPHPKRASKSATPQNYEEFIESVASMEAGTIGVQEQIPVEYPTDIETMPKISESFGAEEDFFDYDAFDEKDFDHVMKKVLAPQEALRESPHLALGDGNSGLSKKRAISSPSERPPVKYRRVTRDSKDISKAKSPVADPNRKPYGQDENMEAQEESMEARDENKKALSGASDGDDNEWVTFTYGGNVVRKRKREGHKGELPDWVMRDMPPELYEEYGDFVDFV